MAQVFSESLVQESTGVEASVYDFWARASSTSLYSESSGAAAPWPNNSIRITSEDSGPEAFVGVHSAEKIFRKMRLGFLDESYQSDSLVYPDSYENSPKLGKQVKVSGPCRLSSQRSL